MNSKSSATFIYLVRFLPGYKNTYNMRCQIDLQTLDGRTVQTTHALPTAYVLRN